ncbi:monocarboxylate transporter 12-like [Daktulosphaira vitifoliae]|uniref:monocarboxylate transporter 12-like n=1 Tax=Daktulosphaira vitifoliae TaxID=58002 RepID=UPI0021A9E6DF|nr:monocarboxylate transporter 12-like [Daktulosphaira vitifoliae]
MNEEDNSQNDQTEPDESTYILRNKRLQTENQILIGPDGDWGWYVVSGSALINFLIPGMLITYGSDVLEEFVKKNELDYDDDKKYYSLNDVRWIPSAFQLTFYLTSTLACLLCEFWSHRAITLWGGFLASTGMLLSFFANSIPYLYFSYGMMVGFGAGLSYPTGILAINKYFNKKRALAVGIATAGTNIGMIVMPTYIKFLANSYGCRGAVLITSGLMLNVIACALIYHPVEEYAHIVDFRVPLINVTEFPIRLQKSQYNDQTSCTFFGLLKLSFLKNRLKNHFIRKQKFTLKNVYGKMSFITITIINTVYCICNSIFLNMVLPAFSKSIGYHTNTSFLLISFSKIIGRILVPCTFIFFPFNTIVYLASALSASGLILITIPIWHQSVVYILVCFIIFGIASGSIFAMQTPVIVDILGAEWITITYSTTLFSEGIAQLAFNLFHNQYYLHFNLLSELYYSLGVSLMFLSSFLGILILIKTLKN